MQEAALPGSFLLFMHDHSHNHHHHTYKSSEKRHLLLALLVNGLVMLLEFAGGLHTHSLALLSDAGHMLTHIFALGMSYFAIVLASRRFDDRRSFGYFRAEVLATFINALFLFCVTGLIVYHAIALLITPVPVREKEMVGIACIGLITNIVSVFLLKSDSEKDMNIRSAFMHVISDTASSVLIIAGGIVIYYKKLYFIDPLLSLLISVLILVWAWRLFKESANILLEATPKHIDIHAVKETLLSQVPEIKEIHDIHIWVITGNLYAATLHVRVANIPMAEGNSIMGKIRALLHENFSINHATIQLETDSDEKCLHQAGIHHSV